MTTMPKKCGTIAAMIVMVLAGMLAGIAFSPEEAEAASPYQTLAGEDYQAIANALEASIKAGAGRTTSNASDGWGDDIMDHSVTFQEADLIDEGQVGNQFNYTGYDYNNVTIDSNGKIWVKDNITDNFNDNFIDTTLPFPKWVEKDDDGAEIAETNMRLERSWNAQSNFHGALLHFQETQNFNTSIEYKSYIKTATNIYTGGIYIMCENASSSWTTVGNAHNRAECSAWITNVMASTQTYRINFNYRNEADHKVYMYDFTNNIWEVGDQQTSLDTLKGPVSNDTIRFSIEYTSSEVIFTAYSITNGVLLRSVKLNRNIVRWQSDARKVIAIGHVYSPTNCRSTYSFFDNFTTTMDSTEAYYTSPAIPCGSNNTVFKSISWTGNTSALDITCTMRYANNSQMTAPSAWLPIATIGGDYSGLNYMGSWMQFNLTWLDNNATVDDIIFTTRGSSYGIPYNGSLPEILIDRDTRWYGQNMTFDPDIYINITDGTASTTWYIENCTINFNDVNIDNEATTYASHVEIYNSTLYNSDNIPYTISGTASTYYVMRNNTFWDILTVLATNDTAEIFNNDIAVTTANSYAMTFNMTSTSFFCYNHVWGGHNETTPGAPYDFYPGITAMYAYGNNFDLYLGGCAINSFQSSADASGATTELIHHNYINRATLWSIGIFGAWWADYGYRNGTLECSYNVIENMNTTNFEWATGIHIRDYAENWTISNNYIHNNNGSGVMGAAIFVYSGPKNIVLDGNFIWDGEYLAGIVYWSTSEAYIYNNFIYNVANASHAFWWIGTGWGIVMANCTSDFGGSICDSNVIMQVGMDGYWIQYANVTCGNDTIGAIPAWGYAYWVYDYANVTIWSGTFDQTLIISEVTGNCTFNQQTGISYLSDGVATPYTITTATATPLMLEPSLSSVSGDQDIWLTTLYHYNGDAAGPGTDVTYTLTFTSPEGDYGNVAVYENGAEVPSTIGSRVWTGGANHTYSVIHTGQFSDLETVLGDGIDAIGQAGRILIANIGKIISLILAIMLMIFALAIPIGFAYKHANRLVDAFKGKKP